MRALFRFSWKTLRLLLVGAALVAFALLVLSRTEVGRDGVRRGLEAAFARELDGTLEIGRLTGNLVGTLYARSVVVRGADGRALLEADSLVLYPTLGDFLRRRVRIDRAALYRPRVALERDSTGWNWMRLVAPLMERERSSTWDLRSLALTIVDGTVTVEDDRPAPPAAASGTLVDFRSLRADSVQAALRLTGEDDEPPMLTLERLALRLEQPRTRLAFDGEARFQGGEADVDGTLRADRSTARVTFAWADVERPYRLDARLFPGELRTLLPFLPDVGEVWLASDGMLDRDGASVDHAEVRHGRSRLTAETALSWHEGRVSFADARAEAALTPESLTEFWPDAPAAVRALAEQARVVVEGDGTLGGGAAAVTWTARYAGAAGRLQSRGTAERQDRWRIAFRALPDGFDLAALVPSLAATRLTGRIDGNVVQHVGTWISPGLTARLAPSTVAGRVLDTLDARIAWDAAQIDVDGFARQGAGSWQATARLERDFGALAAEVTARNARLSALVPGTPVEATFSGSAHVEATGLRDAVPRGSFTITAAHATLARDTVVTMLDGVNASLILTPEGLLNARLDGSTFGGTLEGTLDAERPFDGLAAWSAVVLRQVQVRLPARRDSVEVTVAPLPPQQARTPFRLEGRAHTSDPLLLAIVRPGLEALGSVNLHATAEATTEDVRFAADVAAEAPRFGDTESRRVAAVASATARADGHLDGLLVVTADTLRLGGLALPGTSTRVTLQDRQATVRAASADADGEKLRLYATADLRATRTRLTVDTLRVTAGPYAVAAPAPQTLFAYADGLVLPRFTLVGNETRTRIDLRGALSPAPTDTLYAQVRGLPLEPITRRINPKFWFGGDISADVALTGAFDQPEVTGTLDAPALTWGDDVVGDVRVTSFYTPGTPDVALDVRVQPSNDAPDGYQTPFNRIRIGGTFRLPRRDRDDPDDGALNLLLTSVDADLFFLDHLFPRIIERSRGQVTGEGGIRGTFRRPIFEGTFDIPAGHFEIPKFRLAYDAAARVQVDEDGIHTRGGTLTDARGGEAVVEGSFLFNDYRFFSLDLAADLSRLTFLDVRDSPDLAFYGTLRASGTARLSGPLSAARLRSADAVLTSDSDIFIPIRGGAEASDPGFILFADSTGALPDVGKVARRTSVIGQVEGERRFVEGLDMDLSLRAPDGVAVNLVTDPLAGDVMRAVGAGRVQLVRRDGDFQLFGTLDVSSGEYLFTAGEVFVRRFDIRRGTIVWDGNPLDPTLDVEARYATRVSLAGTPYDRGGTRFLPIFVGLTVQDRLSALSIGLRLDFDRSDRGQALADVQELEQFLNQPDRQAEFATSVLLTNSFLLTTATTDPGATETLASTGNRFAFASLSQLVATQLNRYLGAVLPGVDLNLGVQGERADDLDLTYGIALRLLDERLVIRGTGLYQSDRTSEGQGLQGEFVVEVRLSPSVSVEVFYRREEDVLQSIVTASTGVGLSYNTQFTSWDAFWHRLVGTEPNDPLNDL